MAAPSLKLCALHPAPRLADCRHCATRSLSVCAALEPDELHALEAAVTPVTRSAGQLLCGQGEPKTHVFIITGGTVKTFKLLADGRQQITGFLQSGDFLGLAGGGSYAVAAEAVTQVRLCQVRARDMDALLGRFPRLEQALLTLARDELAAAQEQMLLLGRKNARERVASFLVGLARQAQRLGRPAETVDLPMTRGDVADYLGLTLETVSRVVSALKREGYVAPAGVKGLRLAKFDALQGIAAGEE